MGWTMASKAASSVKRKRVVVVIVKFSFRVVGSVVLALFADKKRGLEILGNQAPILWTGDARISAAQMWR
jgi:hypothetical protein